MRYLRVPVVHLVLQDHLPADLGAVVHDDVHVGPRAELPLPVGDGGQRGYDEEGAADAHVEDLIQEGDGLDGLTQAHLVGQDAVFPGWQKSEGHRQAVAEGTSRSAITPKNTGSTSVYTN